MADGSGRRTPRPIGSNSELVAVISRPLEFASRHGYANVALADGLGPFLVGVLARANDLESVRSVRGQLAEGLPEWATAAPGLRQAVVRRWCAFMTELVQARQQDAGGRARPPESNAAPTFSPRPEPRPAPSPRPRPKPEPPTKALNEVPPAAPASETIPSEDPSAAPSTHVAGLKPERRRGPLDTPVIRLKGVGPKTADRLAVRDVRVVRDVLWFLPRRYLVRPPVEPIGDLESGRDATVVGRVRGHQGGWARRGRRPTFRMDVEDATGVVGVRFFGLSGGFLTRRFPLGARVFVAGRVEEYRDRLEFSHPQAGPLDDGEHADDAEGRVAPVYLDVDGVPQGTLRRVIGAALDGYAHQVPDGVPPAVAQAHELPSTAAALVEVHRPSPDADATDLERLRTPAWRRLIFEELFVFQVGIALRRRSTRHASGDALALTPRPEGQDSSFVRYLDGLPFALTSGQRAALDDVIQDLGGTAPMNRLLQGDVGCGKTAVAMGAAALAVAAGAQVAVMAPTELLADQHLATFRAHLGGKGVGVRVGMLVGGMRKRARNAELRSLLAGSVDVVVGTHALLQDDVAFRRLGLIIVDEQHRFGVRQRLALRHKGARPHVLVMTATPIPRSLSLTLYGDLDVSVIAERPPGRGRVTTEVVPEDRRGEVYERVRAELDAGGQAYFVYPAVGGVVSEEGADMAKGDALRAATEMAGALRDGPLAGHAVGLVHGRMPGADKDAVMADFKSGRIRALVATTVIEVGIDVPGATVMVVEHAERFGLAQLHQLRGRIGRGGQDQDAWCALIASDETGRHAEERLGALARTDDGFEIAEADLVQRGPGEFLGTKQSGLPRFEVADLLRDGELLRQARDAAFALVDEDPSLHQHPRVRDAVVERWAGNVELVEVG